MRLIGADIEGDNLYPYLDKVWTLVLRDKHNVLTLNPYVDKGAKQKALDFIFNGKDSPVLGFHNGCGYDFWVLWRDMGMEVTIGPDTLDGREIVLFDTLMASQVLYPDRLGGHSIEAWGESLGFPKMDFRGKLIEEGIIPSNSEKGYEFTKHFPFMDAYCEQDSLVELKLMEKFFPMLWNEKTKSFDASYRRSQKAFWLMQAQAHTGWKFDVKAALELKPRIEGMIEEIRQEVEPQLPARQLKKGEMKDYTFPAKPWKKDGTFSSHMDNFIIKHGAVACNTEEDGVIRDIIFQGNRINIKAKELLPVEVKMELKDQDALKEWLLSLGWKPTLWNFQKDERGKPIRDGAGKLIKTSPKLQEAGNICENLVEMDMPIIAMIVKYMSLRNRLGVLEGWINNPRLAFDGRLPTSSTGITPTQRWKHSVVVNCPKADPKVLLGKEFRSLFIAEEGMVVAAADASGLENRVAAHYTYPYDKGVYAKLILEQDNHSKNALTWYPIELKDFDIASKDFDKDDPKFKPYRSKAKNGLYGTLYGCSPPKLASILGKPESEGQILYDAFWEANPGIAKFRERLEGWWKEKGGKKYVPGIDGTKIFTRKRNAILNSLFQSCGAIIMDYACALMDKKLGKLYLDELGRPYYKYKGEVVRRVGYFHDEIEYECTPEVAQEIANMITECIVQAGKILKIRVPLEGDGMVGLNWAETH